MTMSVVDGIMGANLQNKEPSAIAEPSVIEIGNAFAKQYYQVLCEDPRSAHKFYGHDSTLLMNSNPQVSGQEKIGHLLEDLIITEKSNRIRVHSIKGAMLEHNKAGIIIHVFGEFGGRRFTQTFLLASQGLKKYYIHHDTFMFCDLAFISPKDEALSVPIVASPLATIQSVNTSTPSAVPAQVTVEKTVPAVQLNGHKRADSAKADVLPSATPEKPKNSVDHVIHEDRQSKRHTPKKDDHTPKKKEEVAKVEAVETVKPPVPSGPKTWANVLGGGANAKTSTIVSASAPAASAKPAQPRQTPLKQPPTAKPQANSESTGNKPYVSDKTLFIGGIQRKTVPASTTVVENELKEAFSKFGEVESVSVPAKAIGKHGELGTAFAFVVMKSEAEVQKVIAATTKGDRDHNRLSIKVPGFGHDGEVTVSEQKNHDRERYSNNRGRGGYRGGNSGSFRGSRGGGARGNSRGNQSSNQN